MLGRRVVDRYGGGDTAIGRRPDGTPVPRATDAVIVYRRNRERMPAHGDELEEALARVSRCAG